MRFISRVLSVRATLGFVLLALVLAPFISRTDRYTSDSGALTGSEAAEVSSRLREEFASQNSETALLVIRGLAVRADEIPGREEIRRLLQPIASKSFVATIASPASLLDTLLVGSDGHSAIAFVGLRSGGVQNLIELRNETTNIVTSARAMHPKLSMHWTGQSAVLADLRSASALAVRRAELIALPATIAIAYLAFGSVSALVVTALTALVVLAITLGLSGVFAQVVPPTVFTRPLVSVLGLALTVDYVLLISRWPADASRSPSSTVRIAGLVVAAGLAGLAIAPVGELRSAALSGAMVAILASIVASAVVSKTSSDAASRNADDDREDRANTRDVLRQERWRRWGTFVVRRPVAVVMASLAPIAFLVWGATTARFETPLTGWLPSQAESVQSFDALREMQRGALPGSLRVLVRFPDGTNVLSPQGWTALNRVTDAILRITGVGDVRGIHTIGTRELYVAQNLFPQPVKDLYLSRDGQETVVDVVPRMDSELRATTALVPQLRALNVAAATALPGTVMRVGGLSAYVLDYERLLKESLPYIVAATAIAAFVALMLLLRAPVVALKAVILNLLVAAAALGATVLVFQHGFGVGLLGHAAVGSIFPTVPVLAFSAAFGVSTDYELFLLSGVRSARARGASHAESVVDGLAAVGSTITRAAIAMSAIFLAFAFSDMLPLAMVGFTLAVAVLLDATVVRLALAPATLALAGRWNWWPGPLSKERVL